MPPLVNVSTRSARAAAARECVTRMQAAPCCRTCIDSRSSTLSAVAGSRLPVGSSARINCGRCTSARAIATRCNWPPDKVCGRRSASASSPTARSTSCTRAASGWCCNSKGRPTLCATLRCGSTWKAWNTKPRCSRRNSACAGSASVVISVSAIRTEPACTVSSPAMQFSSVDLPTPDSPRIATNSPRATCRSTFENTGSVP